MRWGLVPSWGVLTRSIGNQHDPTPSRRDAAGENHRFRKLVSQRRCLIPGGWASMNGRREGKPGKVPMWILAGV